MADALADGGRISRFWLFAPFVLLLLIAVAWSVAWYVLEQRAVEGLDEFMSREAQAGRQWTCADRSVGGYPFRIEVSCSTLAVQRGEARASVGRVLTVAPVYQPRLVIAEAAGPLQVTSGDMRLEAQWRLLQTSLHLEDRGLPRASLVADGASVRGAGLSPSDFAAAAERVEAHLRPDPARLDPDGAYDLAFSVAKASVPALNELVGGNEPLDLSGDALVTRAAALSAKPGAVELERWRQA